MSWRTRAASCLLLTLLGAGCGKKGPPLPPLVRLPAAPADVSAVRRGDRVTIQFGVPRVNADESAPADLSRVDVFALNGQPTSSVEEILSSGERVGSLAVNPPTDPDTPDAPAQAPSAVPGGVAPGAVVHLSDTLVLPDAVDPLFVRSYVVVGINRRGRRGVASAKVAVPLGRPPQSPSVPDLTYDQASILLAWTVADASAGALPGYYVYDADGDDGGRRLNSAPLAEGRFVDPRIEWGAERCYVLRSVDRINGLDIESEASARTCITPRDHFPPAAPAGLQAIASDGAVDLIWEPGVEKDLAGYLVLRAIGADQTLTPVTPVPIMETTFRDALRTGQRATYAVQAVDSAGNASPSSSRVEETAR